MMAFDNGAKISIVLIIGYLTQVSMSNRLATDDREHLATTSQLTIVGEPQSVKLVPGAPFELHCEVFGVPVPTIQWLHNGKVIRMGATPLHQLLMAQDNLSPVMIERWSNRGMRTFQMATTNSKIRIPCADANHAGLYTCLASNGHEIVKANATVTLDETADNILWQDNHCSQKRAEENFKARPAEIYMWTDSRMERPGVSVQLMCRASGNPKPKISWYESTGINGQRSLIKTNDERFMLLENGDLLIKKTPDDVPMSMYQCEAINESGADHVTTMLLEIIDDTTITENGKDSQNQAGQENVEQMEKSMLPSKSI